ncbi:Crp/Fnr family transcriptional regulator [Salibaculum griseiflavum]|uniref:Crp/Fnr family transcriptional regulator n=1 Tax=Salibaculum griseiflavum TaxID=1914409 RepID=UPI001C383006|nr:Crp/Fnr family transcriptional regulator [Salibaculum griseiflavum]
MSRSPFDPIPLFDDVPRAQIDGLGLRWSVAEIPAGNTIFSQDDDSRDVMFLLSGRLIAVYWTAEGREVVFTRFPIGSSLGELSAIDDKARSLAIFAKTDARLLRLEQASYLRLTDKTLELTTLSIDKRVRLFLVRLAIESNKLCPGGKIEKAPTHAEIADMIGANREVVSRTISKLVRQGAIRSGRQRVEILDPDLLAEDL